VTRVPRIFCAENLSPGAELRLPEAAARHLLRVLRLRTGDEVRLFDGRGGEVGAVLTRARGREALARVTGAVAALPESPLRVRLMQGISRGERMDWVIQKATELGVDAIQPVLTERSVVKLAPDRAQKRCRHWTAVSVAACEQCGRSRVPVILPPVSLRDALAETGAAGLRLCLDAGEGGSMTDLAPPAGGLTLLVGPEGGLTPDERAAARSAGFGPIRMGPRVMRTETAALAALAVAQALWGDLSASPRPRRPA
jgi:16S rRNA (uracil1498-N3)-methyltransferase